MSLTILFCKIKMNIHISKILRAYEIILKCYNKSIGQIHFQHFLFILRVLERDIVSLYFWSLFTCRSTENCFGLKFQIQIPFKPLICHVEIFHPFERWFLFLFLSSSFRHDRYLLDVWMFINHFLLIGTCFSEYFIKESLKFRVKSCIKLK